MSRPPAAGENDSDASPHARRSRVFARNWNRIAGLWKHWMGQAKEKWGRLTYDDLTEIAGQREQFAGLLRNRYGYAADDADRALDEFARQLKL